MKYKKNKKSKNIYLILILVILIIISLFFTTYLKNETSEIINYLYTPINFFKNESNKIKSNTLLLQKNKELEKKLLNITIIKNENDELKKEIESLKKQLGLKNIYPNYKIINATIVSRNKSYWYNELIIDKGENDSVEENMAVVTVNGLVGKIAKVYKNSSVVKLITNNTNNNISVGVNNKNGIISGYDAHTNYLKIIGYSTYDEIEIDSIVTTTGLGIFPKGIEVGKVKKIERDNYNISKILYVKPNQDIQDISYVTILGNIIYD